MKELCSYFEISRAGYYKHKNKQESNALKRDRDVANTIISLNELHKGILGYRRMRLYLNKELGTSYSINYIRRLMRILNITSVIRKKRYSYIKYKPHYVEENILNREFLANKPNQKWLTDVTEFKIPNSKEKIYLSPILDLYDKSIVTYSISDRNNNHLVFKMFQKAVSENKTKDTLIHSDRGFQYTSPSFKAMIRKADMSQSMSRPGKCIDNGPMEGFFGILKSEYYYNKNYKITNKDELIKGIKQYIYYYNNERFQSKLKDMTPIEYRNHVS